MKNNNKAMANAAMASPGQGKQEKLPKRFSFIDDVQMDLAELNIKIVSDTGSFCGPSGISMAIETVATDIESNRHIQGKPTIGRPRIINSLERLLVTQQELIFVETRNSIVYDPATEDRFDELAQTIVGTECGDEEKKFAPLLLRHIVWSIKRRLNGHRVDNPIMLNVYGPANCGKSKFVERLLTPLPPSLWFSCSHGDSLMNDERWARSFGDYYAVLLDELGGMKKADLAKLKNSIDAPFLTHRIMGTNSFLKVKNNAQLLGTSNHRLRDTFSADDNVRKYAEIDFANATTLAEQKAKVWEPLNQYDWQGLWRSVNENCERSPMVDDWEKFVIWTSNKCVKQTDTNIWWSRFLENNEGQLLSATEIQKSLDTYYDRKGVEQQFRKGKNALATMLISAGCQKNRSSGKGTFYQLPTKSQSRLYIPNMDTDEAEKKEARGIKEIMNENWE